jgi:hypothetical protein
MIMSEPDQSMFIPDSPFSLFESLVKPAICKVLEGTDGSYRCERDLHHHLTVCLEQVQPLRLGTRARILRTEDPAVARYGTGRRGNIDFLLANGDLTGSRREIALEVNWNYSSSDKICRDFCKLLDPGNRYREAVYFAFGIGYGFFEAVQVGLQLAYELLQKHYPQFALPSGFQVVVAECKRGFEKRVIVRSALVSSPCTPANLEWNQQSERLETAIRVVATMEETMSTNNSNEPQLPQLEVTRFPSVATRNGISYQTAPLYDYSKDNRSKAESVFSTFIGRFPQARATRHKGSYSIFANSVKGTAAKIIIYEADKGKVNGAWDAREGVYILVRTNDPLGGKVNSALDSHGLKLAMPVAGTIAVAPAHGERFAFELVEDAMDERVQSILGACSEA